MTGDRHLTNNMAYATQDRINQYGITTGSAMEYAFWLDAGVGNTMVMEPEDCLISLLIGDGDWEKRARRAILDSTEDGTIYTKMGAALGSRNGDREWMCDVIFAEGFSTYSSVEKCSPYPDFGGGDCDPDSDIAEVFFWINWARLHPDHEDIIDPLTAIRDSFYETDEGVIVSEYDYNGDDEVEERTYSTNGLQYVNDALEALRTL